MKVQQETRTRQKWYIITAEEIDRIQDLISGMEITSREYALENAQKISRIMDVVERRLV